MSKLIVLSVVLVLHSFTFYLGFDDKADDIFMVCVHFKCIISITWGQMLKINMLIATNLSCDDFFPFGKKNWKRSFCQKFNFKNRFPKNIFY